MYALDDQAITAAPGRSCLSSAVRLAEPRDKTRLIDTLTSAFINDPPVRWLYPEADSYLRNYPSFARAFGGGAFDFGAAWRSEDFAACSLWYPPGSEPDEETLISVIEETVPSRRHEEVFALFEAMSKVHPTEPHWYLPLIGVDAANQGRGLGGALMRAALVQCDHDGLPAYLESSNPRNIPFYERHGFRRQDALCVGGCPPIVPMWREANQVPGSNSASGELSRESPS